MKKGLKFPLFAVFAAFLALGTISCSDDDPVDDNTEREQAFETVVPQYVNNTVIATYRSLADESIALYDAIVALKGNKTNANVQAAADKWIKARDYWELSEAFLFGPADIFGIDPHIDTWPLAKDALIAELKNETHLANMNKADGDIWVYNSLEVGLLGFHGIEYILFEEGKAKDVSKITDNELTYAKAVSGDLRNQCFILEAAWAGIDKVTAEKKTKIQAMIAAGATGGDDSQAYTTSYCYGTLMLNPGGAEIKSFTAGCRNILDGCITIADEVGGMKIGQPFTGDDINYIESPYSYNSKVDFIGNIQSIENAYLGGADTSKRGASVSDYIKKTDPAVHDEIVAAINNAITKIKAIPYPFAKNYTSPQAGAAMEACNDLADSLGKAQALLN